MPIYSHEVSAGLRRGVAAVPVFGSAATNTFVLGFTIVLVVVAVCLLFGARRDGDGRALTARRSVRCVLYSLPPVLLLLYVFAGSIAATVEANSAGDITNLVGQPARGEVQPRSADDLFDPAPPAFAGPRPRSEAAPLPAARSTVSQQLRGIEANLDLLGRK